MFRSQPSLSNFAEHSFHPHLQLSFLHLYYTFFCLYCNPHFCSLFKHSLYLHSVIFDKHIMHTSFLHIFALAGAVIAAPAAPSVPLGPPGAGGVSSHWFGPIGGFTGPATGVSTRPFQTPTARTSAPPKSTTKTNTLATIPASSKPSSKPSSVGSAGGSSPSTAVFSIINKLGSPVSTSYIANQTPISGPGKAGVLQNNETAVLTVALNWSGNIAMSEGTPTGDDSLFEATFAPNGLDIDVSYV